MAQSRESEATVMKPTVLETLKHCAYCGHAIGDDTPAPERFGRRFCSESHADEFTTDVRNARIAAAAGAETASAPERQAAAGGCGLSAGGERRWKTYLKRGACWGAPLLLLLAIPLFATGGWAAAGGSLLTVFSALACPIGMYLMMRGMMDGMQPQHGSAKDDRGKEDQHRAGPRGLSVGSVTREETR
jgi:hypothetical protein